MHANSLWNNWLRRLDLHYPEAGVDVRDVHQPARVDRAPGVRPVGYESGCVAGVHVGVFPALGEQVAFQLARDVEHSEAPLIVSHVQRVAGDPDVVAAAILRLEPRHLVRVGEIGDVDHVQPAVRATQPDDTGAAALLTRREHLVADEDVPAVPPARVGAADEARAPGELDLRSEEHTSELQSLAYLVCRLLLEKKKKPRARRGRQHPRTGRGRITMWDPRAPASPVAVRRERSSCPAVCTDTVLGAAGAT